jgi:nucleotide-binding universal stress UspA family protein
VSAVAARVAPPELPDPDSVDAVSGVLLASEDREIPRDAIDFAARLARRSRAPVHVFTIARIWGTSFGFPNPGLYPTKPEWDAQHANVDRAVHALRKKGVEAEGRVVGTRAGAKRIVREAQRLGCDAIVMAADPPRGRLVADFVWAHEPYRVRKRARVPVYLVPDR